MFGPCGFCGAPHALALGNEVELTQEEEGMEEERTIKKNQTEKSGPNRFGVRKPHPRPAPAGIR